MTYRLVDVSMWMDGFTFPGNPDVQVTGPFNFVTRANPEYVHTVVTPTQAGTHVQGPHYFLADGATIDTLPLTRFEGEAVLIDVARQGTDTDLPELIAALDGRSLTSRILLLRSGHMDDLVAGGTLEPHTRPGLSLAAATWLAESSGVSMVAIDSVGLESRQTRNYEVNVTICRAGILILEGLVNLTKLSDGQLWLEAFPLKIRGVEGTPCRAVVKDYGDAPAPAWSSRSAAASHSISVIEFPL